MIISVEDLRKYIKTNEDDTVLEAMLQALEASIQGYTNNDFKRVREANGGEYPADIKMGVVNMLKWDLENRDKVGIASETISRHSVTYFDQSAANTDLGYPIAFLGFLKPYKRARF